MMLVRMLYLVRWGHHRNYDNKEGPSLSREKWAAPTTRWCNV